MQNYQNTNFICNCVKLFKRQIKFNNSNKSTLMNLKNLCI